MPRIAYVILCSCLLAFAGLFAGPANAGDYYGGYSRDSYARPYRAHGVRYSSSCCYRKIVRHVRVVRYVRVRPVRVHHYRPYRDEGYYERPRYRVSYYDQPRSRVNYYDQPRRYVDEGAYVVRRDRCQRHRVRVLSVDGGTVWAVKARCY